MASAEEGPDRESAHAIIVPPKEGALGNIHKTNTSTVTIKEHPNPAQRSLYVQRRGGGCGPELVMIILLHTHTHTHTHTLAHTVAHTLSLSISSTLPFFYMIKVSFYTYLA